MPRVLAVDLGATSARVAAVDLGATPPSLEIVHRFAHAPVRASDGSLRWDWDRLVGEVIRGLEAGCARGPVASIGVDTWGVDYGLLGADGALLSPPYCYRDGRTDGWKTIAERLGPEALYARTGIQLMGINTVFQLAVHDPDELRRAHRLLMLPELLIHALSGEVTGERTSAGTTGLVDAFTGAWATDLIAELGVRTDVFVPIEQPPRLAGTWRRIPVHLVAGHDTASAVTALPGPPAPGSVFVSSGTWLLVGAERDHPDVSAAARAANFSNEPGARGGVRFLKNVMGFWLLERCRAAWGDPPLELLLSEAAASGDQGPVLDATDQRFLAPADMEGEVRAAAGLTATASRGAVVRCILDSLAATTARIVREVESFLPVPVPEIHVLGGGARNPLFVEALARASGVPVRAGPAEATALGNALLQGIALGRYATVEEGRAALAGGDQMS